MDVKGKMLAATLGPCGRNLPASDVQLSDLQSASQCADFVANVKYYLSAGASSPAFTKNVASILGGACMEGNVELVAALLGAGADPEMLSELSKHSPLVGAAVNGHLEIVRLLVAAGAVVTKIPPGSLAPIIVAAMEGHPEIVRFLAHNGANLNSSSSCLHTPLSVAVHSGHLGVVQALVEVGADINQGIDSGTTPLIIASGEGHLELVKYLVGLGAEAQPKDAARLGEHRSPLSFAVEQGRLEVVQW